MAKQQTLKSIQAGMLREASPYYSQLLNYYAGNAGLQLPQTGGIAGPLPAQQPQRQAGFGTATRFQGAAQPVSTQPVGGAQQLAAAMAGQQPRQAGVMEFDQLGVWNNPADRLRFQQAEADVAEQQRRLAGQLAHRLSQQGLGGSSIAAAAQMQLARAGLADLSDFRRNLAIGAGQEQDRRAALLAQLLGFGAGQGAQAQNVHLGQQAQQAQQGGFLETLAPFVPLFPKIKF